MKDWSSLVSTETHIHADYASGLQESGRRLGAKLYVSDLGGDDWRYQNLPEGSVPRGWGHHFCRESQTGSGR